MAIPGWDHVSYSCSATLCLRKSGVGIAVKKAHIREPCVVRMGVEVDGIAGILSAPKLKMLEARWLSVRMLSRPVLSLRVVMVLGVNIYV